MDHRIRRANITDVSSLVRLHGQVTSRPDSDGAILPDTRQATDILLRMMHNYHGLYLLVAVNQDSQVVGTVSLMVVPNFTYGGRNRGDMENLVVDRDHRRQGIATALMKKVKEIALTNNCYKIQWISGDKPEQLAFYKSIGSKTEHYVAHRIYF